MELERERAGFWSFRLKTKFDDESSAAKFVGVHVKYLILFTKVKGLAKDNFSDRKKYLMKIHLSAKAVSKFQTILDAINLANKTRLTLQDEFGMPIVAYYEKES
jgi:hypothetical protein